MSRKNRERRERQREPEQPGGFERWVPKWLQPHLAWNRRNVAKALLIGGGGALLTWAGCKTVTPILNRNRIDDSVDLAKEYGEIVFDHTEGSPSTGITVFKQFHGGATHIPRFQRDTERFDALMDHQLAINAGLKAQLKHFGPRHTVALLEGITGSRKDWGRDAHRKLADIAVIDQQFSLDPEGTKAKFRQRLKDGEDVFHDLNGGLQFAGYCYANGHLNVIQGADPPNLPNLSQLIHQGMSELIKKEARGRMTDADIAAFIKMYLEAQARDQKVRHDYIVQRIQELREGASVRSILIGIGMSHCDHGAVYNDEYPDFPLEKDLMRIPDSRAILIDPHHLSTVIEERGVPGVKTLILGKSTLTPENVRLIVEEMVRRQRGAHLSPRNNDMEQREIVLNFPVDDMREWQRLMVS